jgi:hypothetical protein
MANITYSKGFANTGASASTAFTWTNNVMSIVNVTDPPTEAEIIGIFGTAAAAGSGFVGYINDNNAGTAVFMVASTGAKWVSWKGAIAS